MLIRSLIISCIFLIGTTAAVAQENSDSSKPKWILSSYFESFIAFKGNEPKRAKISDFQYNHNRYNIPKVNHGFMGLEHQGENFRMNVAAHLGTYVEDNYKNEPGFLRNIYTANIGFRINKQKNRWIEAGIFPSYIVFPTIATLFLAFIRMTVSLRQASALTDEKTLARTDELTGLPNRRKLIAALSEFSEVEGALMLLDLDGFKQVNDRSGHRAGDQVLIQVAARFARVLPEGALLARLGGDEFGILLAGSKSATQEIAQALQACVSYPFLIDGEKISVGVSIGHVDSSEGGDLLAKADAAMYRVKRSINS